MELQPLYKFSLAEIDIERSADATPVGDVAVGVHQ